MCSSFGAVFLTPVFAPRAGAAGLWGAADKTEDALEQPLHAHSGAYF